MLIQVEGYSALIEAGHLKAVTEASETLANVQRKSWMVVPKPDVSVLVRYSGASEQLVAKLAWSVRMDVSELQRRSIEFARAWEGPAGIECLDAFIVHPRMVVHVIGEWMREKGITSRRKGAPYKPRPKKTEAPSELESVEPSKKDNLEK